MDINQILDSIKEVSNLSEKYFLDLGNLFTSLLNKDNSSSLKNLQNVMSALNETNNKSTESEHELFDGYADKYNPLFEELNSEIVALSEMDKKIAGIKEDSEQMELIALNAMVISIKSGEKGQAFSRITENLQRLSHDMLQHSDQLLKEEQYLIDHINTLKEIFSNILASQKKLSTTGSTGSSGINSIITSISAPITKMEQDISLIYPIIQKSMENLQLQDIIRQALEHIKSCLLEIQNSANNTVSKEDELDSVYFNLALYNLSIEVLNDVINNLSKGFSEFDENWNSVTTNLESLENQKNSFSKQFLDPKTGSPDNISAKLTFIIEQFSSLMDEFSNYHLVQKDLLHTTQSINEKARTMYAVFGNLRPVMSRLHHVRILQQIEVSKNEAITSVKDSVTDMDNLINSANESLDQMEQLLSTFIHETSVLLSNFTESISSDNQKMLNLRKEKTAFFDELQITQKNLNSIISNFSLFPLGFEDKCKMVASDLSGLVQLNIKLKDFKSSLIQQQEELSKVHAQLLAERNLTSWEIKNSKFKELINHFTITSHKEVAGKKTK